MVFITYTLFAAVLRPWVSWVHSSSFVRAPVEVVVFIRFVKTIRGPPLERRVHS